MKFAGSILTLLIAMTVFPAFPQNTEQVKKDFVRTFSTGNASGMQKYFEGFVSVDIPDNMGLYTAVRSQSQLQGFFEKNRVSSFSLKQEGFTGKKFFLIGCYHSKAKSWNVYFLMIPKAKSYCIQQMEIEETK